MYDIYPLSLAYVYPLSLAHVFSSACIGDGVLLYLSLLPLQVWASSFCSSFAWHHWAWKTTVRYMSVSFSFLILDPLLMGYCMGLQIFLVFSLFESLSRRIDTIYLNFQSKWQ